MEDRYEARVCKRVGQLKQNKSHTVKENQSFRVIYAESTGNGVLKGGTMAGVDWISVWETAGGSRSAQSDLAHWQGQHPKRGTAKQQIELFGLLDPFDLLALSVFLVVALEELPFFFGGFWPPLADLEDHLAGFGQWVPGARPTLTYEWTIG